MVFSPPRPEKVYVLCSLYVCLHGPLIETYHVSSETSEELENKALGALLSLELLLLLLPFRFDVSESEN